MTRRTLSRRTTVVVGALTAALGLAGVLGAVTVQPHASSRAAAQSPYFICLGYAQVWGICIGPPTT